MMHRAMFVHDQAAEYHSLKRLSNSGIGKILKCPAMIKFETGENVGLEYTKIIDAIVG